MGSSILDSVTEEAALDFESSILSETAFKYKDSESDILNSQRDYSKEDKSGRRRRSGDSRRRAARP